jgi:glucose/arabinose dehydrogenase
VFAILAYDCTMRYPFLVLFFVSLCIGANAQFPAGFAAISVAQNLDPTVMTLAPNGDLLLCEKSGKVLVVRNGQLLPQPMLEIAVDNFNERGLSGIAVHPDYPNTPYVYVYYTVPEVNHNRVIRVEVVNDLAIPGSAQTLLDIDPMPGTIHNGGAMLFGPDGMLYIAVGDGAGFGVAQSLGSFLGKILRIRPDGSIPEDNPFYQQASGNYRAIWATGLRNPFTFTLQPGTGRMAVGDVGGEQFEEVNLIEKGKNYGWPLAEGPQGNPQYENPLHAYNHQVGCCIAGAAFYNPQTNQFPAQYNGMLFFGEYCQGKIWYINPATGGAVTEFATGLNRPIALLTHPDGSLYCITRGGLGGGSMVDNTSSDGGVLWRITYNPAGLPLVATQPEDALHSVGETAQFRVTATGNTPFSFQWLRNGTDSPGDTLATLWVQNVQLADSAAMYACKISNNNGTIVSEAALLRVTTNQRPTAFIELPVSGTRYRAGEVIFYSGSAFDPELGVLPAQNLTWRVDFHHTTHLHPAIPYTPNQTEGGFFVPQTGETSDDVWYRIHLYATDPAGLSSHVWQDVLPEKSLLRLQTQPSGLPLYLDGQPVDAPADIVSVEGVLRTVEAPTISTFNNEPYLFEAWSDGDVASTREFETPASDWQLTANYTLLQKGTGTGLLGLYFGSDLGFFNRPVQTWRVDPEIDFNWEGASPFVPQIGVDNFAIRWLGKIEPWISGYHTFYITGDDGVRLWINNQLVIDSWVPSDGDIRTSTPVFLETGRQYPIRIEYNEIGGRALIHFEWGLGDNWRTIVPASQLYPAPYFEPNNATASLGNVRFRVVPNPFSIAADLEIYTPDALNISMEVYDVAGHLLLEDTWLAESGFSGRDLRLSQAPPGMYFVKLSSPQGQLTVKLQKM